MKILIILLMSLFLIADSIDNLIDNFDNSYKKSAPKKSQSMTFDKNKIMSDMPKKSFEMKTKVRVRDTKLNNDMTMHKQALSKDELLDAALHETKEYIESFYVPIVVSVAFFSLFIFIYIILSSMKNFMLGNKIKTIQDIVSQEVKKNQDIVKKNINLIEEIKQMKISLSSLKITVSKHSSNTPPKTVKSPAVKENKSIEANDDFSFDDDFDSSFDETIDETFSNNADEELNLNAKKESSKNNSVVSDLSDLDLDIKEKPRKTKRKSKTKIEDMEDFNIDDFD